MRYAKPSKAEMEKAKEILWKYKQWVYFSNSKGWKDYRFYQSLILCLETIVNKTLPKPKRK